MYKDYMQISESVYVFKFGKHYQILYALGNYVGFPNETLEEATSKNM